MRFGGGEGEGFVKIWNVDQVSCMSWWGIIKRMNVYFDNNNIKLEVDMLVAIVYNIYSIV